MKIRGFVVIMFAVAFAIAPQLVNSAAAASPPAFHSAIAAARAGDCETVGRLEREAQRLQERDARLHSPCTPMLAR